MKQLKVLLKREWLEWQRVIIGTIIVITFLNLLTLLSVSRGSHWLNDKMYTNGHVRLDDVIIRDEEKGRVDIHVNGDEVSVTFESDEDKSRDLNFEKAVIPIAYSLRIGFQAGLGLVLFLSLFYFADTFYKERSDNSTLFYRSLPVRDHLILSSKLIAGMLGIVILTLFLSIEYLIVTRLGFWLLGEPLKTMVVAVWDQIAIMDLLYDWMVYLVVVVIRLAPAAGFLMLVSSYVKGRPLLIGVGSPILFAVSWAIVFRDITFLRSIGNFFLNLNQILADQWLITEKTMTGSIKLFGNFWGHLFAWESLVALAISAVFYAATMRVYRQNIPVS